MHDVTRRDLKMTRGPLGEDAIKINELEKGKGDNESAGEFDYQQFAASLSFRTVENLTDVQEEDNAYGAMRSVEEVTATEGVVADSENEKGTETENAQKSIPNIGHDRAAKERTLDVQTVGKDAEMTFEDLMLNSAVLEGLKKCNFLVPSPIQLKAIPHSKLGCDLILQSKSGTGKTCAFGVIVLENMDLSVEMRDYIQAVVISPTREVAYQTKSVIRGIGCSMRKEGLRVKVFIGGTKVSQSVTDSKHCNVVCGTPGRILHMVSTGEMDLSHVQTVVLDEADRLMEKSFITDLEAIFKCLPSEKQVIAASATYPNELQHFIKRFMRNVSELTTDPLPELLGVPMYAANVFKILGVEKRGNRISGQELFDLKMKVIMQILQNVEYTQTIIFSQSILTTGKIYETLKELSFDVNVLTGALSQQTRLNSLRETQSGKCNILVSSDLGSRGIDCEGVDLVINFEVPDDPATYVHRNGRAGRFGTSGTSISLLAFRNDFDRLSAFISSNKFKIYILNSTENIRNMGKKHAEKFRRVIYKGEILSLLTPGLENWAEALESIMNEPLEYPSLTMDALAGFKLNLDFDDVARRVDQMKEALDLDL